MRADWVRAMKEALSSGAQDFARTAQTEGLYSLCYKAAWLTLSQQNRFSKLRFQVNGRDFEPEAAIPPADINEVP